MIRLTDIDFILLHIENVDLTIVYDTLTNDVPYLKKTISETV